MVDPFADGEENAAGGKQHQDVIADEFDIDGERQHEKNGGEYEHSLIPIVNDEFGQRIAWFHLSLLLVVDVLCAWLP